MEHAHRFMEVMMAYPVAESGEALVSIPEAAEEAGVELLFSGTPIVDGLERIFEVRQGVIGPLLAAASEMNERGWVLKIEDGFRTAEMQRKVGLKPSVFDAILEKAIWESGRASPEPDLVYRRLSVLAAGSPKVAGHMAGCAVDISVVSRATGALLDRGGPYLEMSERTPMYSPFISPEALHLRAEITEGMARHGFAAYPFEFWHYSFGDVFAEHLRCTGSPARYAAVHRDPVSRRIEPVRELSEPLRGDEQIRREIAAALARLRRGAPTGTEDQDAEAD